MKKITSVIFLSSLFVLGIFLNQSAFKKNHVISEELNRDPASRQTCADLANSIITNEDHIAAVQLKKVNLLLKSYGITKTQMKDVKSFEDAINEVWEKVMSSRVGSLKKGEQMVKFGKEIRKIYTSARLNKEEIKDLDFVLGRNVLRAESFLPTEFKKVKESDFAMGRNTNLLHINYKQYKKYVTGFENNAPPYTTLDTTGGTIIGRPDIREMEAHNLFPVYIPHDMKHIQQALYHERYLPMLFGAARGKNHKRYVMMAALAEGADTVQFSEESAICTYFDQVKKLNLEEGVMWIARASDEELDELATTIGYKDTFDQLASSYAEWVPPVSRVYSLKGATGVGLDQEIDDMFLAIRKQHSDADLKERFKNRDSKIRHY